MFEGRVAKIVSKCIKLHIVYVHSLIKHLFHFA